MSGLYSPGHIEVLQRGVARLTPKWGLSPRTSVSLVNISENATFRADDPDAGAPVIFRVHRPGYHRRAEIRSELAWIAALRSAGIVPVPEPLRARDGELVVGMDIVDGVRDVVAFAFVPGRAPAPEDDLTQGFRALGAISAGLHRHAAQWRRPEGFARKTWDFAATVGPEALWGDWRAALGLSASGKALLEHTAARLERALRDLGQHPDRFGLIHADLRLANLLLDKGEIAVIDFDDCGFGWHGFDFAAAISFIETDPSIPDLKAAWIEGYRTVSELPSVTETALDTFVMLRRLQLTAWVASHAETPEAAALGPAYTDGTLDIADRWLASRP